MRADIRAAIERAAQEEGVNPAFALAVAERESGGNPSAHNSKTIHGIFQMRGDLRHQFGIGDSEDPYTQAKGWARFINQTKGEMSQGLGRAPTDSEAYLGHHFGSGRAAKMLTMDPSTPVSATFSPYERSINPHFDRAGTVGRLNSSVIADMDRRAGKYGGQAAEQPDFAQFGTPAEQPDFASFGEPIRQNEGKNFNSVATSASNAVEKRDTTTATPPSATDFSQFGTPA